MIWRPHSGQTKAHGFGAIIDATFLVELDQLPIGDEFMSAFWAPAMPLTLIGVDEVNPYRALFRL